MLENDLKYLDKIISIKKIKELYDKYYFSWLYPFTNENIKASFYSVEFQEKDVLTVTSSGDHALNSLFNGASSVDCFDLNPLAKYYVELKLAGIKSLSYEEFILFFYNSFKLKKNLYLDKNIYATKIRKELSGDYLQFWDYFMNRYLIKNIKKSYLFSTDYLDLKNLIRTNEYLNEDNYYKLKKILNSKKLTYYDYDINNLFKINKKYDILVFSNIINFLKTNNLSFLNTILNKISKDDSIILLTYLYTDFLKNSYIKKFETLKDFEYRCEFFDDYEDLFAGKSIRNLFSKHEGIVLAKKNTK